MIEKSALTSDLEFVLPPVGSDAERIPDVRAALYARLSRDRDGQETATTRQLEDCRAFAAARGWTVVDEFTDADVSAYKRNAPRPGYDAMVAALDGGRIDVVVAWKMDRLLRRVMDWEKLWERAEPLGVHVATVRDGIDTAAPMVGELLPRLMATFAQLESKNLSVREKRKHEETARAGKRSGGGHRPFGLSRDWSEIVEPEAERIRAAVDGVLAGGSLYAVAAEWNRDGIRTTTGRTWTVQLVRSMLASPRLAGQRQHRGEIVGDGVIPVIVDADKHERLRAILDAPSRRRTAPAGRFLLSGLLRCAKCGGTLFVRRRHKDKRRFYGCEKVVGGAGCGGIHVVAEPLEEFIGEMVLAALDSPEVEQAIRDAASPDLPTVDLSQMRADEDALEQLARDHYVERAIGRAEFLAARDALEARISAARESLSHPAGGVPALATVGQDAARQAWTDADLAWRRALIESLVDQVTIAPAIPGRTAFDPDRVTIGWRY